ncbi:hypothetical protein D3C85_1850220 [compost metagenome]
MLGLAAGHIGGYVTRDAVFANTGLQIQAGAFVQGESLLIMFTLLIAIVASIGPAVQAYRVDPLQLFRS